MFEADLLFRDDVNDRNRISNWLDDVVTLPPLVTVGHGPLAAPAAVKFPDPCLLTGYVLDRPTFDGDRSGL